MGRWVGPAAAAVCRTASENSVNPSKTSRQGALLVGGRIPGRARGRLLYAHNGVLAHDDCTTHVDMQQNSLACTGSNTMQPVLAQLAALTVLPEVGSISVVCRHMHDGNTQVACRCTCGASTTRLWRCAARTGVCVCVCVGGCTGETAAAETQAGLDAELPVQLPGSAGPASRHFALLSAGTELPQFMAARNSMCAPGWPAHLAGGNLALLLSR
jgi:hypothetical protein